MGNISLSEDFNRTNFDDWEVVRVRCYDKPAVEAAFVDMRHSFLVLDLENTGRTGFGCIRKLQTLTLGLKDYLCKKWHGSQCHCCICRKRYSYRRRLGLTDKVTILIEVTGTARKGAYLNQVILEKPPSAPSVTEDLFMMEPLEFCGRGEQLLIMGKPKNKLLYGKVRKELIHRYLNQKYDIKERNCYHFLMPTDIPLRRFDLIQANVRKHTIVTPPLERLVETVNRHL
jgi:hypothetical protein